MAPFLQQKLSKPDVQIRNPPLKRKESTFQSGASDLDPLRKQRSRPWAPLNKKGRPSKGAGQIPLTLHKRNRRPSTAAVRTRSPWNRKGKGSSNPDPPSRRKRNSPVGQAGLDTFVLPRGSPPGRHTHAKQVHQLLENRQNL